MTSTTAPASAESAGTAAPPREFLSFRLGAEEYGIDILKVQEIRGYEIPTRLANAADFVLGVVNLRGVIVPILDMRIKFGMPQPAYDSQTVTIVLNVASRVVGMVVDAVSDVIALQPAQIKPAPEFSGTMPTEHIIGLAAVEQDQGQRMLILLDIEQVMGSASMGLVTQTRL